MRTILKATVAALIAAFILPLLFIATESAVRWNPIVADDFGFAYTLAAPFALVTALAVAWPSYCLQHAGRSPVQRMLIAAAICFAVPVAAFLPLADEFPWKAGVAGSATLLLWVGASFLAESIISKFSSIRSEPSG